LTLGCTTCNTRKGAYDAPECPLVNPYDDDPETHLQWVGPLVRPRTPDRGRVTVSRLDLNRPELVYQRGQRVLRALEIIDLMGEAPEPVVIALREDLRSLIADHAEYAAAVRSVAQVVEPDGEADNGG
jgi:hypothetical protein